jgi:hypothetical protein
MAMSFPFWEAYLNLIRFDLYVAQGGFAKLDARVRKQPVENRVAGPDSLQRICSAVDMACIWYWKEVLCLQRSAAAACLLKRYGVSAQLVIGVQQLPFKAHAWVEVDSRVINDKLHIIETYAVLDRC